MDASSLERSNRLKKIYRVGVGVTVGIVVNEKVMIYRYLMAPSRFNPVVSISLRCLKTMSLSRSSISETIPKEFDLVQIYTAAESNSRQK
jgi:hypothetical protein